MVDVFGGDVQKRTLHIPCAVVQEATCREFSFDDIPFGGSAGLHIMAKDVREDVEIGDDSLLGFGEHLDERERRQIGEQ